MITEPTKTFSRMFRGYDRAAVDAHIEMLTTQQELLRDDVESLMARLKASHDEAAGLRKEIALLTDTSPSPHAVQQRMAKMLRQAVDEVSEMEAEARAEAAAVIAAAEAEAEAAHRKRDEVLADLADQQEAMEAAYQETTNKLEAELARMRAETQAALDEARHDAEQECDQLLGDAKLGADHYREQAQRAVDEAGQQRIRILEQLVGIYRDLEAFPAALESAYREATNAPEETPDVGTVVSFDDKARTG